jgi:hypothetical protein
VLHTLYFFVVVVDANGFLNAEACTTKQKKRLTKMHPVHALYAAAGGWCVYRIGTFVRRWVVTSIIPIDSNPTRLFFAMRVVVALLAAAVGVWFFVSAAAAATSPPR